MQDTRSADLTAPFGPPPSAADVLASWSWRDVTDAMREHGFAVVRSRFIDVTHDRGGTILAIDEDGDARVCLGVEIDFIDVIVADVIGRRLYEADLTIAEERARNSLLPEVA